MSAAAGAEPQPGGGRRRLAARLGVALAAALVLAWLAVMARDNLLQSGAATAAHEGRKQSAVRDLRAARFLNPDATPDRALASIYLGRGQRERALALARSIVRREPSNLDAWALLLVISRRHDPATARRATAAIGRLDPFSARRAAGRR